MRVVDDEAEAPWTKITEESNHKKLPFPTAPQGISMGKGQGRESSSLGFRFFRRWARRRGGGGSSTMRPKLRGQKSRRKAITKK